MAEYDADTRANLEIVVLERRGLTSEVPDAPLKKTWPLLAIKRVIRWAADNNHDSVAWTTGDMQHDRYNLSHLVERIAWNAKTKQVLFVDHAGEENWLDDQYSEKNLRDLLGRERADELIKAEPDEEGWRVLDSDRIDIGGKGMRVFYDKMLPAAVNKYVKKWGAKVSDSSVLLETKTPDGIGPTDSQLAREAFIEQHGSDAWENASPDTPIAAVKNIARERAKPVGTPVHSFDITPRMRRDVRHKQQPLFANRKRGSGRQYTPEQQDADRQGQVWQAHHCPAAFQRPPEEVP